QNASRGFPLARRHAALERIAEPGPCTTQPIPAIWPRSGPPAQNSVMPPPNPGRQIVHDTHVNSRQRTRYSVGPFLVRVHLYVPPWSHTPTSKAHVSQKLWPVQNACVQEAQPHGQGS
ncbi:hypothetical protein POSPLADRAFT_1108764, partial [Postia placenta MAD-698-R-SB12]